MSDTVEEGVYVGPEYALENYVINTVIHARYDWFLVWGGLTLGNLDGNIQEGENMSNWEKLVAETLLSSSDADTLKPRDRTDNDALRLKWLRAAIGLVIRDPRAELTEAPFIGINDDKSLVEGQAERLFGWSRSTVGDPKSGPGRIASLITTTVSSVEGEGTDEFMYLCEIRVSYDRWKKYFTRRMVEQCSFMRTPQYSEEQ